MIRPVLTIVAGSNGCGKSSLTSYARVNFQQFPLLDPDAIARSLQESLGREHSNIEAGKRVLRDAENLIVAKQSFTVETTLSGSTYLRMALRAREAGFNIVVFFVGTTEVEINLLRVKARVLREGTTFQKKTKGVAFPRTLANMKKLLPFADLV